MHKVRALLFTVIIAGALSACKVIYFYTPDKPWYFASYSDPYCISYFEVSLKDWIMYMAYSLSPAPEDEIFLGDHKEEIKPLLPEHGTNKWVDYVMDALQRQSERYHAEAMYLQCGDKYSLISIPASAWDTIRSLRLIDLPVTGISYEQAMGFLKYRERVMNDCKKLTSSGGRKVSYECFLPTPEQMDSLQFYKDSLNAMRCEILNYKHELCVDCPMGQKIKDHPVLKDLGKHPVYVDGFFPDYMGLYNIRGNVAEMTSVKGIAKGGSCNHYASETMPGRVQYYTKPESWLGFRVWYRLHYN